ncbi:hypothetical protein K461DRAFT_302310 [Myriangium duriaei CBS 260.36]|uniref:Homeobox domain-containing protein n=1 Tax=Myriangium duriaei CBS 260.36 TaxID=1168546 RepID=A0A9P4IWD1_9PEZI|nr:hypothetical protein K461DRAFT_302310 [Myriangium duriaei CBS 260.36]
MPRKRKAIESPSEKRERSSFPRLDSTTDISVGHRLPSVTRERLSSVYGDLSLTKPPLALGSVLCYDDDKSFVQEPFDTMQRDRTSTSAVGGGTRGLSAGSAPQLRPPILPPTATAPPLPSHQRTTNQFLVTPGQSLWCLPQGFLVPWSLRDGLSALSDTTPRIAYEAEVRPFPQTFDNDATQPSIRAQARHDGARRQEELEATYPVGNSLAGPMSAVSAYLAPASTAACGFVPTHAIRPYASYTVAFEMSDPMPPATTSHASSAYHHHRQSEYIDSPVLPRTQSDTTHLLSTGTKAGGPYTETKPPTKRDDEDDALPFEVRQQVRETEAPLEPLTGLLTNDNIAELKKLYEQNFDPDTETKIKIAKAFGVKLRQIREWFWKERKRRNQPSRRELELLALIEAELLRATIKFLTDTIDPVDNLEFAVNQQKELQQLPTLPNLLPQTTSRVNDKLLAEPLAKLIIPASPTMTLSRQQDGKSKTNVEPSTKWPSTSKLPQPAATAGGASIEHGIPGRSIQVNVVLAPAPPTVATAHNSGGNGNGIPIPSRRREDAIAVVQPVTGRPFQPEPLNAAIDRLPSATTRQPTPGLDDDDETLVADFSSNESLPAGPVAQRFTEGHEEQHDAPTAGVPVGLRSGNNVVPHALPAFVRQPRPPTGGRNWNPSATRPPPGIPRQSHTLHDLGILPSSEGSTTNRAGRINAWRHHVAESNDTPDVKAGGQAPKGDEASDWQGKQQENPPVRGSATPVCRLLQAHSASNIADDHQAPDNDQYPTAAVQAELSVEHSSSSHDAALEAPTAGTDQAEHVVPVRSAEQEATGQEPVSASLPSGLMPPASNAPAAETDHAAHDIPPQPAGQDAANQAPVSVSLPSGLVLPPGFEIKVAPTSEEIAAANQQENEEHERLLELWIWHYGERGLDRMRELSRDRMDEVLRRRQVLQAERQAERRADRMPAAQDATDEQSGMLQSSLGL